MKLSLILILLFILTSCAKLKYASSEDLNDKLIVFIETNENGHLIQSFSKGVPPKNWYLNKSEYIIAADVKKHDFLIIVNNQIKRFPYEILYSKP